MTKRLFDIIVSAILLLAMSPILAIVACRCIESSGRRYFSVNCEALKAGWPRDRIMNMITGQAPLQRLPRAVELGETSLMFLVHPTLRADELGRT